MLRDGLYHVVAGGGFGVDLFFVLSAYLITELFRRERLATGGIAVRAFYMRRILRIWPLYFAFVLFWFAVRKISPPPVVFPVPALLAFLCLSGNWYMSAVQKTALFYSPVSILWSVSVEEQFYLIWPLIVKFATKSRMAIAALVLLAASYAVQFWLLHTGTRIGSLWMNSFVHGGAIAIGILSALALEGKAPRIPHFVRIPMLLAALPLFGLADLCYHSAPDGKLPVLYGMMGFGAGLIGVTLIFYALLGAPTDGMRFETSKVLLFLGRISYGLYVFHYALLEAAKLLLIRFTGACPPIAVAALALPVTVLFAWASYRWFELPFLRVKRRFAHVDSGPVLSVRTETHSA